MLSQYANDPTVIAAMAADEELRDLKRRLHHKLAAYKYTYNFTWFGRPIIQLPEDVLAFQEIILATRPEVIIETGIAHGGSLALSASMLELLGGDGIVVGIDLEIRPHNRAALEAHPMFRRMRLFEGSSVDESLAAQACALAAGKNTMVILDSNHAHDHVVRELELYSHLVRNGGYVIVCDTSIEDMPPGSFPDRPWDKGSNPRTAVWEFLKANDRFTIDHDIENRLLQTVCGDGFLKCVKD